MKVLLVIGLVAVGFVQAQVGGGRAIRVRGRPRPVAQPLVPLGGQSFAPVPNQRLVSQCPELEGLQLYPDPATCNRFFKCANGTLTHETCGNGLLFDVTKALAGAVHNHCAYNWNSNCDTRPAEDIPVNINGCEYEFGIYPSGPGCNPDYVKCEFAEPKLFPCKLGLVYDQETRSCNWPDLLIEKLGCNPSALLGGFVCPSPDALSPLAARFAPFPRFAVNGRDDLFIICVNNQPRLQTCGEGTIFDPSRLSCIEPPF